MKKILLTILLMFTAVTGHMSAATSGVDPEVKAHIISILNACKSKESMVSTMASTYEAMSGQLGIGITKAETKDLVTYIVDRIYPQAQEKFVEVWNSHFTPSEIKEIAAFYATPAGRKLGEKNPVIAAEGVKIGTSMATEIQNAFMEFMKKKM